MVKTQHDTSHFTSFGLLLDELLQTKSMSYRQLAKASGMSEKSAMTIIRACRGKSTPERENIIKWCEVLGATPEQRHTLLQAFHYIDDEQDRDLIQAHARIAGLEQNLVQANTRIKELEQDLAQLKKSDG